MASVIVEGTYLNSYVKNQVFDGNQRSVLYIDLYQQDSDSNEKSVTVRSDDVNLLEKFKNRKMGEILRFRCQVNAYRNQAYFRLLEILQ
ncbi:hypothetical protein [Bacillus smithii]|uniref:hypothetical protein n=1 Tax=Bacillus smithii TaxID=1479 RepID=UPI003D257F90